MQATAGLTIHDRINHNWICPVHKAIESGLVGHIDPTAAQYGYTDLLHVFVTVFLTNTMIKVKTPLNQVVS